MYRNTYAEVNLKNIESNVRSIIKKYDGYNYYFGVVKADCYGHNGVKTVEAIIKGGCNYVAVATLEEALEIRKHIKDIPILCLGIIPTEYVEECIKNDITITISNLEYLEKIIKDRYKDLKVHIKVNTGMNRLGTNNKEEFDKIFNIIKNSQMILEGVYTHIYNATNEKDTNTQFIKFEEITSDVDLSKIPIVHICASDATMLYKKLPYVNGCRLGINIYGLMENSEIPLLPTFRVYSQVIQINTVENETVGYSREL